MSDKKFFAKALAVDMLLMGYSMSISIVGQLFASIRESYSLTLTRAGFLLSMQSIGGLIVAAACTLFMDALNKRGTIVSAGLLLCVFVIGIGMQPSLWMLFCIFAVTGFAGSIVNILSNSVMVETVPRHPEKHMNIMHMLFSLGAAACPFIAQWLYGARGIPGAFFGIGAFMMAWALYALFVFRSDVRSSYIVEKIHPAERFAKVRQVFKKPGMVQVILSAFMIHSWQISGVYYISSLFTGINGNATEGALALSTLFVGITVARLAYTRVAHRFSQGRVLMWGNLLGLMAWTAAMTLPAMWLRIVFVGVSALCCGNNFPLTYMAACKIAPRNTATASGFVGLMCHVSLFVFVPLVGALGDRAGLNIALLAAGLPLLLMVPIASMLHKRMAGERA